MTLARWLRPLPLALALAMFGSVPAVADLTMPTMDGALPLYPKAVFGASLQGHSESAAEWKQVWAQGFPTEVFSHDDVAAVDLWYRAHLHAYARRSKGSHAAYTGAGGTVAMFPTAGTKLAQYGKTAIILEPN